MKKYLILSLAPLVVLGLDQATKALIKTTIPLYGTVAVIRGFFNITHVRNTGGAFGILAGETGSLRTTFFIVITVGALVLIFLIFRKVRENRILAPLALAMVIGGALGNLVDRIRWGYVIDFLDLYWETYHWPAFNVADSAITVGICLLVIDNLFLQKGPPESEKLPQSA